LVTVTEPSFRRRTRALATGFRRSDVQLGKPRFRLPGGGSDHVRGDRGRPGCRRQAESRRVPDVEVIEASFETWQPHGAAAFDFGVRCYGLALDRPGGEVPAGMGAAAPGRASGLLDCRPTYSQPVAIRSSATFRASTTRSGKLSRQAPAGRSPPLPTAGTTGPARRRSGYVIVSRMNGDLLVPHQATFALRWPVGQASETVARRRAGECFGALAGCETAFAVALATDADAPHTAISDAVLRGRVPVVS